MRWLVTAEENRRPLPEGRNLADSTPMKKVQARYFSWVVIGLGAGLGCTAFGSEPGESSTTNSRPEDAAAPQTSDGGVVDPPLGPVVYSIQVLTPTIVVVRGKASAAVEVVSSPAMEGSVTLEGLPSGVTSSPVSFRNGRATVVVEVAGVARTGIFRIGVLAREARTSVVSKSSFDLDVRGAPGEVDENFDASLKVVPTQTSFGGVSDLLPLPDGGLLLASSDELRKYRPDGVLDSTFGSGGKASPVTFFFASATATYVATAADASTDVHRIGMLDVRSGTAVNAGAIGKSSLSAVLGVRELRSGAAVAFGGLGANWAAVAVDVPAGTAASWGGGGVVSGVSTPAFEFFPGTTEDDVFVRMPSGVKHVVLSKSGTVLRSTDHDLGEAFNVAGVVKRGSSDFLIAQGTANGLRLYSLVGDVLAAFGTIVAGSFGASIPSREFRAVPGGFVAVGSSGTGLRLVRFDGAGQLVTSFGTSGIADIGTNVTNGRVAVLTLDQRFVIAVAKPAGASGGYAVVRVWL